MNVILDSRAMLYGEITCYSLLSVTGILVISYYTVRTLSLTRHCPLLGRTTTSIPLTRDQILIRRHGQFLRSYPNYNQPFDINNLRDIFFCRSLSPLNYDASLTLTYIFVKFVYMSKELTHKNRLQYLFCVVLYAIFNGGNDKFSSINDFSMAT